MTTLPSLAVLGPRLTLRLGATLWMVTLTGSTSTPPSSSSATHWGAKTPSSEKANVAALPGTICESNSHCRVTTSSTPGSVALQLKSSESPSSASQVPLSHTAVATGSSL